MGRLKLSGTPGEDELIYYKPWATKAEIQSLFGIGRRQVEEFRQEGWVLARKHGTNVVYRCKDVDATLTRQAVGMAPVRARATA